MDRFGHSQRKGRNVESFEQFVALAMESEGLVVSEALKFPVARKTKKAGYEETQTGTRWTSSGRGPTALCWPR